MQRGDRPSLDARNKNAASIILVSLYKVTRGLFSWDSDKRYTLVGRLEPDNFWLVGLSVLLMTTGATIAMLTLSFLLLLGSLTTRSQKSKSSKVC